MDVRDFPPELSRLLISALDMVVLVRRGPMDYVLYGEAPPFYTDFFSPGDDEHPCQRPWERSAMLESFIVDSEQFFESDATEAISTSYWLEETGDDAEGLPLIAWARKLDNWQLLLIQCVGAEYAERSRILRQARNMLLERRAMSADLISFRKKALYDPLTQVYNRNGFTEFLSQLTGKVGSSVSGLALVMLDIDDFKKINDELGHLVGDQVLAHLGRILRESLRSQDTPVRFGGEEFIVLAPGASLVQAFILGEKLRKLIEKHDFEIGRSVTVSVGGTMYNPGEEVSTFIERADRALYDSKRNGKNVVCVRDPWVQESLFASSFKGEPSLAEVDGGGAEGQGDDRKNVGK
ncbi:hypothetical protein FACS1894205_5430 [Alphaproteobacteria bacterium]|nr:hypothetical protein FACS1894205_5430 [Alphaproteobacteria bacterium]